MFRIHLIVLSIITSSIPYISIIGLIEECVGYNRTSGKMDTPGYTWDLNGNVFKVSVKYLICCIHNELILHAGKSSTNLFFFFVCLHNRYIE